MTLFLLLPIMLLLSACSGNDQPDPGVPMPPRAPVSDSVASTSWLSRYDIAEKTPQTHKVSNKLREVSGLAISADGRLLAHDDEDPIVYVLSFASGEILKRFTVGSGFMEMDFEGIATKQDTIFLVSSSGEIFAFREPGDREHTDFVLYRTPLSEKNDVEGLEYDPVTDCLLLACKGSPGKGYEGNKAVYAFSLKARSMEAAPRYLIPTQGEKGKKRKGVFSPSGIALHPESGTFFILSAESRQIIELDRQGVVLALEEIPSETNSQPEGITFAPDGSMLIANDGQGEQGTVTVYPVKPLK